MSRHRFTIAAFLWIVVLVPQGMAHFNMLFPESASVKRGEPVTLIYQWGHPFEHQLFDAPKPERLLVLAPDGKKTDLTKSLEKIEKETADKKKIAAYRLRFTPEQRGDYTFLLSTPPIWMKEDSEFLQDTVKVVLHVQTQKGWDAWFDEKLELSPLTRPYGLQAGMVFQAQALREGKGLAGTHVEIERYNDKPPATLPLMRGTSRPSRDHSASALLSGSGLNVRSCGFVRST